jgi:hypothetical protein
MIKSGKAHDKILDISRIMWKKTWLHLDHYSINYDFWKFMHEMK